MDGFGKTLYWFQEENLKIEVPFFQRPYVWDEENWKSLIFSIENSTDKTMPFIGSFILQEKEDKYYLVIDGQQRITTLTVLVKAFLDYNINLHPNTKTYLNSMIYNVEMIDSETYIQKPRLTPSNADKEAYEKVMAEKLDISNLKKGSSKIEDCYLFFNEYFKSLSKDDLKRITDKFMTTSKYIIIIKLGEEDDEQEIFDTVNSLGKRLTNSDIVKNYLYQKMKSFAGQNQSLVEKVLSHYKKYWEKIFIEGEKRDFWDERISLGRITTTNLDAFLKDYGTIKGIYLPSDSGGYEGLAKKYKEYIDKLNSSELEAFSIELSEYATTFYQMKMDYIGCDDFRISDVLNTTLLVLDKLESTTFNPYILKLIKNNEEGKDEKLRAVQRFVLKRFLWKASIKNYNKVCLSLLSSANPINYLDSYNEQTIDVNWFDFPQGIKTIKNNPANLILFIIEMIRRNKKGEDNYSDALVFNKTLEHIMPQKWEKNWNNVSSFILNEKGEYEEVLDHELLVKNRKNKIYSLGNMTLLTSKLNKSISNGTFKDKIEGGKHRGIKEFVGSISVAQEIVDIYNNTHSWNEKNIFDREISLANELNDFYNFVDEIGFNYSDDIKPIDISYFDEKFFERPIGIVVKTAFEYLIKNNCLNKEDYSNLNNKEYCSKNTGCAMPVLVYSQDETVDSRGRRRYYKNSIGIEKTIFLCKEWYENDKSKIIPWLKNKMGI